MDVVPTCKEFVAEEAPLRLWILLVSFGFCTFLDFGYFRAVVAIKLYFTTKSWPLLETMGKTPHRMM